MVVVMPLVMLVVHAVLVKLVKICTAKRYLYSKMKVHTYVGRTVGMSYAWIRNPLPAPMASSAYHIGLIAHMPTEQPRQLPPGWPPQNGGSCHIGQICRLYLGTTPLV